MTNRLFVKIIASYLIICIIPIVAGLFSYSRAARSAEEQTRRVTSVMLERSSAVMDKALEEIESVTMALAVNSDITRMVSSRPISEDASSYYRMYDARQALANNKLGNESLIDIMLYCERSDIMITSSHIFIALDRFYDLFFRYGDMSLSEWSEAVLMSPEYTCYYPARTVIKRTGVESNALSASNAMLYTRSVPTATGRGKLIVCISLDALAESLDGIFEAYDGGVLIFDEQGSVLAELGSVSDEVRGEAVKMAAQREQYSRLDMDDSDMLLVSSKSQQGWCYVAALGEDAIFSELNAIRFAVWLMIGMELLLLVVLAVAFTRRSVKPVKGLMELVDDVGQCQGGAADEYDYLRQMITLMKQNYQRANSRLSAQTALLRRQLLASRLRGDTPADTLRESFARAQLRYPGDEASVALLLLEEERGADDRTRGDLARLIIGKELSNLPGDSVVYARMDDARYAVVFFAGDDTQAQAQYLANINAALLDADCQLPIVSIAPPDGCHTLSQRYTRADIRIHRWDARPGELDWVSEDTEMRSIGVHYSVKVEERIIRAVRSGTPAELKAVLTKVVESNHDAVCNDADTRAILAGAFRLTCARAQREAQFTPADGERDVVNVSPASAITQAAPLEDFYAWCMRAAEQIERQRKDQSGGERIAEPVCAFLDANYADKQLSLNAVAERFGFSETYFSRLFKAQKGESYSEYLERVRIGHACELLRAGESVESTADKVGYNSVTVFRSAFKRICGATPSEYKNARSGGDA